MVGIWQVIELRVPRPGEDSATCVSQRLRPHMKHVDVHFRNCININGARILLGYVSICRVIFRACNSIAEGSSTE